MVLSSFSGSSLLTSLLAQFFLVFKHTLTFTLCQYAGRVKLPAYKAGSFTKEDGISVGSLWYPWAEGFTEFYEWEITEGKPKGTPPPDLLSLNEVVRGLVAQIKRDSWAESS